VFFSFSFAARAAGKKKKKSPAPLPSVLPHIPPQASHHRQPPRRSRTLYLGASTLVVTRTSGRADLETVGASVAPKRRARASVAALYSPTMPDTAMRRPAKGVVDRAGGSGGAAAAPAVAVSEEDGIETGATEFVSLPLSAQAPRSPRISSGEGGREGAQVTEGGPPEREGAALSRWALLGGARGRAPVHAGGGTEEWTRAGVKIQTSERPLSIIHAKRSGARPLSFASSPEPVHAHAHAHPANYNTPPPSARVASLALAHTNPNYARAPQ